MTALDLDELIASGQVEADPVAVKHARLRVLERAALAVFRADPLMLIPMVEESHKAVAQARAKALAGPPPILKLTRPVKPSRVFTTWHPEPGRREAEHVPTPPHPVREIEPRQAVPEPKQAPRLR